MKSNHIQIRIRTAQTNKVQPSLFFDSWGQGNEIKDQQGRSQPLYHGTTHDFNAFDMGHRTNNRGGYFGKGFYFTNNQNDAASNYARIGPDLKNRIDLRAEAMMRQFEDDPDAFGELPFVNEEGDWDYDEATQYFQEEAKKFLIGNHGQQGKVMPNYVRMNNPIVLEPNGGTSFEFEPQYDEDGEIIDDEHGSAWELYQALRQVGRRYDIDSDAVWADISDNVSFYDGGANAWQVDQALRNSQVLYSELEMSDRGKSGDDDDNTVEIGPFIADVYRQLGHDGIDMNAWAAFGPGKHRSPMDNVTQSTRHYITWEPTAVKSSEDNSGIYDPDNPQITAKNIAKRLVQAALAIDRHDPISANMIDRVIQRLAWDDDEDNGYDDEDDDAPRPIRDSNEFWLHDGQATYANGDIGDSNHESIALEAICSEAGVSDVLGEDFTDWDSAELHFYEMAQKLVGQENTFLLGQDDEPEDAPYGNYLNLPIEQHGEDFADYIRTLYREYGENWHFYVGLGEYLKSFYLENHQGAGRPEDIERASKNFDALMKGISDPRKYARQSMDWIAVRGRNVELYSLNEKTVRDLYNGLNDAYDYPRGNSFNIEVDHPVRKTLFGIPFEDIESGAILKRYHLEIGAELRAEQGRNVSSPENSGIPAQNAPQNASMTEVPILPQQALYGPQETAKNVQDQMRGIPGYKSPQYDFSKNDVPRKPDGSPVYKYVGARRK